MKDLFYFNLYSLFFFFCWYFSSKRKLGSINLYFYHLFWGAIFLYYSLSNPADIRNLFLENSFEDCELIFKVPFDNSSMIFCFSYLLKTFFINSYGFLCSIFCFVGFLGLNTFYEFSKKFKLRNKFDKNLISIFFFLPTLSFWTSINYKDSLVVLFYATSLEFIYDLFKEKITKTQILKVFVSSIFVLMVRPYSFLFIITAFLFLGIVYLIKMITNKRIYFFPILFLSSNLLLFFLAFQLTTNQISMTKNAETGKPILFPAEEAPRKSLKKFNFELIQSRIELSKIQSGSTNSNIDQLGFNKMIVVLFGPFSLKNNNYKLETLSGLIFFIIFCRIIYLGIIKNNILKRPIIIFSLVMISLEIIKINLALYNLGAIMRHRIPIQLLFTLILVLQSSNNDKLNIEIKKSS